MFAKQGYSVRCVNLGLRKNGARCTKPKQDLERILLAGGYTLSTPNRYWTTMFVQESDFLKIMQSLANRWQLPSNHSSKNSFDKEHLSIIVSTDYLPGSPSMTDQSLTLTNDEDIIEIFL